ncbi:carbohydrate ABC transporter permease [Ancylobacter mangrovi]|uniref:carbohydrate ABC transporter permease n=1 Tax=Ancylobacter mangrovi TaxID=2972472 RepID=UPI002161D40C|nr:sugar ABC transporter permease [Ancylobacter mangrovi]MCS0500797.1 sugar ABC transporter permease [Ancylobacter mangrovi]
MSDIPIATVATTRRRRKRIDLFPYMLIAPICLLLAAVTVYPTLKAVELAMTNASLLRLQRAAFIGLNNFRRMLDDQVFLDGLWRTLRWDLAVVSLELAIALPIALFLNLNFRGRGFVRAAMMVPYITPPAVVGLLFLYMFDGNFGVVNDLLVRAGLIDNYVAWMSSPLASFWIVVSAMVWYGAPLMALILLAALQTIPGELYEAAQVDGASRWSQFVSITIPHILPTIFFLVLLRMIWMSNHIDMIFVMTGGGPGFSNHTEAVYSFMLTNQFQIGYASAIAVVLAAILMFVSAFYVRHLARNVLVNAS